MTAEAFDRTVIFRAFLSGIKRPSGSFLCASRTRPRASPFPPDFLDRRLSSQVLGRIRFGTSSWSEKAWAGVFYPAGLPPSEQLAFYATQFHSVEADVTYYRVPDRKLVEGWARKTPDGFVLSAKFPRSIVHAGETSQRDTRKVLVREHTKEDVDLFLNVMGLLGAKCGPLVLQFPYFNRQAFPERGPFLERLAAFLDALPPGFRYGVELRNQAWIDSELLDVLRVHNVALVMVDLAYLPHPAHVAERLDLLTADFAYGRLIGDRKGIGALTDRLDRVVMDQSERLSRWAVLLHELRQRVPETYVYANNHYAGYAPATVGDLAARVEAVGR